jgi:hypothetical protein
MDPGTPPNLLCNCRESSPEAGKPLQISPFMQNKANFFSAKMSINSILTKEYERNDIFAVKENKANQSQFRDNSKACFSPQDSIV